MPRAELAAVIDAMTHLPRTSELEAVVDASYVVKTGSRIIRALDTALTVSKEKAKREMASMEPMFGCNGDLWIRFAALHVEREATMRFSWIKSHQTGKMVLSGRFSTRDTHGNILADAFADNAAERAQLPEGITDEYFSARDIAFQIRKRLIAVHKNIRVFEDKNGKVDICREYKEKREPKQKVDQTYADDVLRQLGHQPSFFTAKGATCFQCKLCKTSSTIRKLATVVKDGVCIPAAPIQPTYVERAEEIIKRNGGEEVDPAKNIEQWKKAIKMARQQPEIPPALAAQPPTVGKAKLHCSHHIHHEKGVFICTQCGFYATKLARRLAKPCGPSTTSSRNFLARFHAGEFPRKGE